jgi:ubiquinone/menaquinone biosynthesis C-methylase UbiE
MRMSDIEKFFVNSQWHARNRIKSAQKLFDFAQLAGQPDCLEIGCGNGAVSVHFARKYDSSVVGTDVDPAQVELAQKSVTTSPNIKFLVADATGLPFEDSRFDVVMSFQVMHHIVNWLDALREARRVLKPGGYFIYSDIIFTETAARLGRFLLKRFGSNMYGITTMQDLNSFVESSGFSTVHISRKNSLMWYNLEAVYQSH